MAIFERNARVDISKVNSNALITNKGMLSLLENVACMHSDTAGCGIIDIPRTHLSWVQLNWKVKIFKRLNYGGTVTIRTWARNATKVSTLRDFEVLDEQGNVIAKAMSKWVLINIQTEKLERVTDEILFKYNPELEKFAFGPDEDFEKLKEQENYAREVKYSVKRSDIDVNNHMHNINYLDLANEALPDDIYFNSKEFDFFQISYKKEIKLGENVRCKYLYENGKHMIAIKSEDNSKLHAIIELR